MKNYIAGILFGLVGGGICGYICLLFMAPMGGGQLSVSLLPWIVGIALSGGLIAQAWMYHRLQ